MSNIRQLIERRPDGRCLPAPIADAAILVVVDSIVSHGFVYRRPVEQLIKSGGSWPVGRTGRAV